MKTCFKCKKEKPLDEYYVHRKMADGHLNKCIECAKTDVRLRYDSPEGREKCRAYDFARNKTERRRQSNALYLKRSRAIRKTVHRARNILSAAVRDKKIEKLACAVCGNKETQAHHPDYSSPLKVIWLCFKHHREIHGQKVG